MIAEVGGIAKLPIEQLTEALAGFLRPVLRRLPEERLRAVVPLAVQGIIAARSPVVSEMAAKVVRADESNLPLARRVYRFLWNERFSHEALLTGLYGITQAIVEKYSPKRLVVALDPVNLEKPYTKRLEGVSTVLKSTPPALDGDKRLTRGYPAITATVVNLPLPAITYANWFSYVTEEFQSQNREVQRAIESTRALFPEKALHFVGDSEFDDQKVFDQVAAVRARFTFRAKHLERRVEVYNERLDRWEAEALGDLTASVPLETSLRVSFTHARRVRKVKVGLGWLRIRLPGRESSLWIIVVHDPDFDRDLVLITNVEVANPATARAIYTQWRFRPKIEHTYRFDQEDGLDLEDLRVRTVERMRRLFVLVLLAALFVHHVGLSWSREAVTWLRYLGGKFGLDSDRDGPYLLLAGISAVFVTASTLAFAAHYPFPSGASTYG
jgi:hypothetical protein